MDRVSVESNFLINPPISGTFDWAADSRSVTFHHDGPFDPSTNYTARILGTAQDDADGTVDGDFDGLHEGSPSDDFAWTFRFPIANDDFASAQLLAGAAGSVAANTPTVLSTRLTNGIRFVTVTNEEPNFFRLPRP